MSGPCQRVIVTGGAGFIGRWVVGELLDQGHRVRALDDCSSGAPANLAEFEHHPCYDGLIVGDVRDAGQIAALFRDEVDICYHLAAKINVQRSIDDPRSVLDNDVIGAFNVLEAARKQYVKRIRRAAAPDAARTGVAASGAARTGPPDGAEKPNAPKFVFVSTCMVYTPSRHATGIDEDHPVRGLSPYAACKLAGEQLTLSYFHAYGLPATVLRPFNTFGPYQRSDTEGGVVAIFLQRALKGAPLLVRGDGRQTRDLLYVKDCARFIVSAGLSSAADGMVLNAGLGRDITINELAHRVARGRCAVRHVPHDHPQAEIEKLLCNNTAADRVLGWRPRYDLDAGLAETETWMCRREKGVRHPLCEAPFGPFRQKGA